LETKKPCVNKDVVFVFSIFFLLIGVVLGSSDDTYINNYPWSLDDDIIVLSNTSHKVKIDINASTIYLLEVGDSLCAFKLNTEGGKLEYTISKKEVKLFVMWEI